MGKLYMGVFLTHYVSRLWIMRNVCVILVHYVSYYIRNVQFINPDSCLLRVEFFFVMILLYLYQIKIKKLVLYEWDYDLYALILILTYYLGGSVLIGMLSFSFCYVMWRLFAHIKSIWNLWQHKWLTNWFRSVTKARCHVSVCDSFCATRQGCVDIYLHKVLWFVPVIKEFLTKKKKKYYGTSSFC